MTLSWKVIRIKPYDIIPKNIFGNGKKLLQIYRAPWLHQNDDIAVNFLYFDDFNYVWVRERLCVCFIQKLLFGNIFYHFNSHVSTCEREFPRMRILERIKKKKIVIRWGRNRIRENFKNPKQILEFITNHGKLQENVNNIKRILNHFLTWWNTWKNQNKWVWFVYLCTSLEPPGRIVPDLKHWTNAPCSWCSKQTVAYWFQLLIIHHHQFINVTCYQTIHITLLLLILKISRGDGTPEPGNVLIKFVWKKI